jgi:hypothetical protein
VHRRTLLPLLSMFVFPAFYPGLVQRFAWEAIAVLTVRNLLLCAVVAAALPALARTPRRTQAVPTPRSARRDAELPAQGVLR